MKLKKPVYTFENFLIHAYTEIEFQGLDNDSKHQRKKIIFLNITLFIMLNCALSLIYIYLWNKLKTETVHLMALIIIFIDSMHIVLIFKSIRKIYYAIFSKCPRCHKNNQIDDKNPAYAFFICEDCRTYYKIKRESES